MKLPDTCAVIFDVDGVLLYLTEAEEDVFFQALEDVHGITGASRDWNSYQVRNDVEIIEELIEARFGKPAKPDEVRRVIDRYGALLDIAIRSGDVEVKPVPGIKPVLTELGWRDGVSLGVATANLKVAADMRLKAAGLKDWFAIGGYADSRGPKAEILAQVIAHIRDENGVRLPPERIVFLGDNPNDVEAGRKNRCRFIGFAVDDRQHELLRQAGAPVIVSNHDDTLEAIGKALEL